MDEYFIARSVLCFDANCCCPFVSFSKVGNATLGAQKMGFVRSSGSAGTKTTLDSVVDDRLCP